MSALPYPTLRKLGRLPPPFIGISRWAALLSRGSFFAATNLPRRLRIFGPAATLRRQGALGRVVPPRSPHAYTSVQPHSLAASKDVCTGGAAAHQARCRHQPAAHRAPSPHTARWGSAIGAAQSSGSRRRPPPAATAGGRLSPGSTGPRQQVSAHVIWSRIPRPTPCPCTRHALTRLLRSGLQRHGQAGAVRGGADRAGGDGPGARGGERRRWVGSTVGREAAWCCVLHAIAISTICAQP